MEKAEKRRVGRWNGCRESGQVKADVGRAAEDGLGAALLSMESRSDFFDRINLYQTATGKARYSLRL